LVRSIIDFFIGRYFIHCFIFDVLQPMFAAFLYAKEIEQINGVCSKTARQLIKDMNAEYHLPPHKFVSLKTYCDYFRADERHVIARLESMKGNRES
jgi:hypothetical protein